MNNLDFINDALTLIGVLPEGQEATAEQGVIAMRFANELVDEWADDGLYLNWTPNTSLADSNTLSGSELTALKYHLAVRLCPVFGRDPSQSLVALAMASFARLIRMQAARNLEPVDTQLPAAEGGGGAFDYITGTIR